MSNFLFLESKQGNHHHHHADGGGCCGGHSEVQDTTTDDNDRDEKLELIIQCVREQLGDNVLAIAPSENITIPSWSADFEDYDGERKPLSFNLTHFINNKFISRSKHCPC